MEIEIKAGLYKTILQEGFGENPLYGDKVIVHYIGRLMDGTKFDSSRDRGAPFEFTLGKSEVIKGWDEGIKTMKKGEKILLTCKPEYAYGETGQPPTIPPKSSLQFEIELIKFIPEDISPSKDGGILKSSLSKGEGYSTPNDGSTVKIHIVGKCKNDVFQDENLTLTLDDSGSIIKGLEYAIKKMKKGERARFIISPIYAYGNKGDSQYKVPPNSVLTYEIHLYEFEKAKESWELDLQEKLKQSMINKEQAAIYFKDGKYQKAISLYQKIVDYLQYEPEAKENDLEKINYLKLSANSNLSICYLKLGEYNKCLEFCEKVLQQDPNSEKAHYRIGIALIAIKDYDKAIKSFKKVIDIDSNNKAAVSELCKAQKYRKELLLHQKQLYANIFNKMAKMPPLEENIVSNKFPDMTDNTFDDFEADDEEYDDMEDSAKKLNAQLPSDDQKENTIST